MQIWQLTDWAQTNPALWGNEHGSGMFFMPEAFGAGVPTPLDIAAHWEAVAARIEALPDPAAWRGVPPEGSDDPYMIGFNAYAFGTAKRLEYTDWPLEDRVAWSRGYREAARQMAFGAKAAG